MKSHTLTHFFVLPIHHHHHTRDIVEPTRNSVPEVTGGAGSKKQKTKAGIEEEKMDFPQHKMPILNAAVLKEIGSKTGARMRVVEGRIKTGAVKKGIQATLVITGSAAAVKATKSDAVERLKANAASTVKTEGGKYEFKKKSLYNDGQGGQGGQPLCVTCTHTPHNT